MYGSVLDEARFYTRHRDG